MLVKDDSCIAEQTILKYQSNNVAKLLGSDWYGIFLRHPNGDTVVDTCYNVTGVDDEIIMEFAQKEISYDFLHNGSSEVFEYKGSHFYIYPIRKTNKGYIVFFLFFRQYEAFNERDILWYKTYAQTGYQRLLLENELIQVQNYNNAILDNADCAVVVVDKKYRVVSANALGEKFFGNSKLKTSNFKEADAFLTMIEDVFLNGNSRCMQHMNWYPSESLLDSAVLRTSISPLRTSKGIVSAVILIATDLSAENADAYTSAIKQQYKQIEKIYLSYAKDVRTSLMNIKGCAEIISNSNLSDEDTKLLEYINEETDKIETFNREMEVFRAVNETETDKQVDLNSVLFNCKTIVNRCRANKRISVSLSTSQESPFLRVDSSELYVALLTVLLRLVDVVKDGKRITISSRFSKHLKIVNLELKAETDSKFTNDHSTETDIVISNIVRSFNGTVSVQRKGNDELGYLIGLPTA